MIKCLNDLQLASHHLDAVHPIFEDGQLEVKMLVPPHKEDLEAIRKAATDAGFHAEDESHEIEGRHFLTLTWHF